MMRLRQERKYIVSILVISVILIVLDFVFFGSSIGRSPSDLHQAGLKTLYSVYWVGIPLLFTSIVGIVAGLRKRKALVIAFMVLSIITCVLAAGMALLFTVIVYSVCGSLIGRERAGRDGKTCKIDYFLIVMVIDAALVFICCLIGSILSCYHTCPCCPSRNRDEPENITLTPISTKPSDDPFR